MSFFIEPIGKIEFPSEAPLFYGQELKKCGSSLFLISARNEEEK
jgi:hypothetical protein